MNSNTSNGPVAVKDPITVGLKQLLDQFRDKRVVVLGTTCTGKSTLLRSLPEGRDQDDEVFPLLTPAESEYVCQQPWTPEIGRAMTAFVRERVRSRVGRPVFGTVVIDADLVVLLKISDSLLQSRAAARGTAFGDAKNMQAQLEEEVRASGIPWIEYPVG